MNRTKGVTHIGKELIGQVVLFSVTVFVIIFIVYFHF